VKPAGTVVKAAASVALTTWDGLLPVERLPHPAAASTMPAVRALRAFVPMAFVSQLAV
jgi:hypothetical protein